MRVKALLVVVFLLLNISCGSSVQDVNREVGLLDKGTPDEDILEIVEDKGVIEDAGVDIPEDGLSTEEDSVIDLISYAEDVIDTVTDTGCKNECYTAGKIVCDGEDGYRECIKSEDGCMIWSNKRYCSEPPKNYCVDSKKLRVYDTSGKCVNDRCEYGYNDRECVNGCENGMCKNCTPDCSNKECGDDGCGGSCGSCGANATCSNGSCVCNAGYGNCDGLWSNGCEKRLDCLSGETQCVEFVKVKRCIDPHNNGCTEWGDPELCPKGTFCDNGSCISPACVPNCDGKSYGSPDGCGGVCSSILTGTFVVLSEYDFETNKDYLRNLLDEMVKNRLYTVIVHSTAIVTCSTGCTSSRNVSDEMLGWFLNEAGKRGMEVYVGLSWCEESNGFYWWNDPVKSACISKNSELVDNFERIYGTHPAFKGYYIVQEAFVVEHSLSLLDDFYPFTIDYIHQKSKRPVIAGGYLPIFFKGTPYTTIEVSDWVKAFVNGGIYNGENIIGAHPDIFLLQDGVGSFDNPLYGSFSIQKHLEACRDASRPARFWADIELFQWSLDKSDFSAYNNWYRPAYIKRVNQQLYIASLSSERRIAWITTHHMSRYLPSVAMNKQEEALHLLRGYKAMYFEGTYYSPVTYNYNIEPSNQYPDSKRTKLFDSIEGRSEWSDWVGWNSVPEVVITIDLGSLKSITDVSAVVMSDISAAINYPEEMRVEVSRDGINYSLLGVMTIKYKDQPHYSKAYLYAGNELPLTGRYVKVTFKTNGVSWLFLSELEVYGINN